MRFLMYNFCLSAVENKRKTYYRKVITFAGFFIYSATTLSTTVTFITVAKSKMCKIFLIYCVEKVFPEISFCFEIRTVELQ